MISRSAISVVLLGGFLLMSGSATAADTPPKSEKTFAPKVLGMDVPVITSSTELDKHLGRLVALRGVVSDMKLTYLVGVSINASDELRDREAYAVGILGKFTLTEEAYREAQEAARKSGNVIGLAIPGPGVRYTLYSDFSGKLAEARPLPK